MPTRPGQLFRVAASGTPAQCVHLLVSVRTGSGDRLQSNDQCMQMQQRDSTRGVYLRQVASLGLAAPRSGAAAGGSSPWPSPTQQCSVHPATVITYCPMIGECRSVGCQRETCGSLMRYCIRSSPCVHLRGDRLNALTYGLVISAGGKDWMPERAVRLFEEMQQRDLPMWSTARQLSVHPAHCDHLRPVISTCAHQP